MMVEEEEEDQGGGGVDEEGVHKEVGGTLDSPEGSEGNKEADQEDTVDAPRPAGGQVVVMGNRTTARERLERVRLWSVTKYKTTRQALCERMGRGSRTVDPDLQTHILVLQDDRRRYEQVTRLAQTLALQLGRLALTHGTLGDAFAELSFRTPPLHVEFGVNADTQRFLSKRAESLVASVDSFGAGVTTLVSKTIQDTLDNVHQYEATRVEYDAYRCDLEDLTPAPVTPPTPATRTEVRPRSQARLEHARRSFQNHQHQYLQARDHLDVKLKLLHENRVKVLQTQLVLFHSAMSSCNSACHLHLQQASATLSMPSAEAPSWLEDS